MSRIIQFFDRENRIKTGEVKGEKIHVLREVGPTYDLVQRAFEDGKEIVDLVKELVSEESLDYPRLVRENRLLLPLQHPDPYHTWITGTGLTHLGSAASRNAMHQKFKQADDSVMTDSMRMFQMGLENGKMEGEVPGVQPEWFYKGNGLSVAAPGQPIISPAFALDGGEEPELVGIYVNGPDGNPVRVGFALGNEFSDHQMEKINYLYLAHSKLRMCSYGPELLLGELPEHLEGQCRIIRNGEILWEKTFLTGEKNMSHNIQNLEYHHFKYPLFRQPGDVHIHYLGTSVLSFADGIAAKDGDVFEIEMKEFGKPLTNLLRIS